MTSKIPDIQPAPDFPSFLSAATNPTSEFLLRAPVSGVVVPLEKVPDPVFAQKIVGVGVAIDPTGQDIVAPCAGRISQLHPSHHAVAIISPSGIEVLIHVGLDTVKLKGEGFTPLVAIGAEVRESQPLLRFDADLIAQKAKSLLTEVILTNSEVVERLEVSTVAVVARGEPLIRLRLRAVAPETTKPTGLALVEKSDLISIRNSAGLHARPAALLASLAKRFDSEIFIQRGTRSTNARSLVGIMGLEIDHGDQVQLEARGADAGLAIKTLVRAIENGLGEEFGPTLSLPTTAVTASTATASTATAGAMARATSRQEIVVQAATASLALLSSARARLTVARDRFPGVIASPGRAIGKIHQLRSHEAEVLEHGGARDHEAARLYNALREARHQLEALSGRLRLEVDAGKAGIFSAHVELLDDPEILELARERIEEGKSAAFSWRAAYFEVSSKLLSLHNPLLAARATDVRDVGQRVLRLLVGERGDSRVEYPDGCILVAEDLTPSDLALLDPGKVLGLVTTTGGATSHVAILARSLDLAALAGVDPGVLEVPDGTPAVVDAIAGELRLRPSGEETSQLRERMASQEVRRKGERARSSEPATTRDGRRIEVVANLKSASEAPGAVDLGAEGVGLLRTEFLFMNRPEAPTEEEQLEAYGSIARAFGARRPVIIRTLDVGGDKPLRYLPIPREENPFLGERGLRVSLNHPELFRSQLRAILRASEHGDVRVMFPMVALLEELREARAILEEERARLGARPIPAGIMVEVPAVAILADQFAAECDFFSIGSNDLSQYTLAIDRGHPRLAGRVDGLDPSLLWLIDRSVRAAHARGGWAGVCGGVASDPEAVPFLIGLGVDELSVSIPAIPAIKARIRELSQADCEKLAKRALGAGSAAEVRSWLKAGD